MKKIGLVTIIGLFLLLTACGSPKDEEITLRFSWWGGESRHEATNRVIELYESMNPDITIKAEYTGWSGHFDKIATQIAGKNEADIMQINYNWFYLFSPNGEGFVDLQSLDGLKLDNWESHHLEALTINGKVMGIPASIGGRLPYFNQASYDAAGIDIPKTWDELLQAGPIFKDVLGDDYYPMGSVSYTDDLNLIMFSYLTQLTAKNVIEADQLSFTKEELILGYEFIGSLFDNHVIPDAYKDPSEKNQQNIHWINGEYAGSYQWNSSIGKYVDALNPELNPKVVSANYLTQEDALHSGAYHKVTMGFAISNNSKYPEEAAKFLDFMYTNEEAIEILGLSRAVPVNKVAFTHLESIGLLEGLQYEGHLIIEDAQAYAFHPYYEDILVKTAYYDVMNLFAYGDKISPEEAADMLIENFNKALKEAMTRGD